MKKALFLIYCMLTGFTAAANIGKVLGSSLTYQILSPNNYRVTFIYTRDCTDSPAPTTLTLQLSSPGCNSGRTVTLNQAASSLPVRLYCPNDPPYCSLTGQGALSNFYTAMVTFTTAEALCRDWYFSVTLPGTARAEMANLAASAASYTEAYVRLENNLFNNSPEFTYQNSTLAIKNYNEPATYLLNAIEPDGDSLVYELTQPQSGRNLPVPFKPGFTANAPIPSATAFTQSQLTGDLSFLPNVFVPNVTRSQGNNRYAVAMRIKEYRQLNGVSTLVGYITREQIVEVDPQKTISSPPQITLATVNGNTFNIATPVTIMAGQMATMQLSASDPDLMDNITMTFTPPLNASLTFQVANNNSPAPVATLNWAPSMADAGKTVYLPVKLEDNGCPVKAMVTTTLEVRIGTATSLKPELQSEPEITVFPNPSRTGLNFTLNVPANRYTELLVFDLLGREIERFRLSGGISEQIVWPGAAALPAGQYFCRLSGRGGLSRSIKFSRW